MPGSNGIECMSPNFLFGGTYFGTYLGKTLHGTYIVNHIVGHDAPKLLQENEVPLPLGRSFSPVYNILEK